MIGRRTSARKLLGILRDPVPAAKRAILARRWQELDHAIRLPGQGLGRKATGCGATIGVQPRCDFACTGCYLGREANQVPALPTAAVLAQLDELRRHLGPKSNVQITDGEVTLRPLPELVEILRHARSIGVIPMIMTHGDVLRRQPGLLERLMVEGALTEISVHIDITQRGRLGYRAPVSELELMPLREEIAALLRAARRRTGRPLRAAMTLTVTEQNLPQVADVVRWTVRNRDAFSLISFQPLARVGRTRAGLRGAGAAALWREIGKAVAGYGLDLRDAQPLHFGHPECTRFVPLLAVERPGQPPRLLQLIRDRPDDLAIMDEFFAHGLGGVAFRDDLALEAAARGAGLLAAAPRWFFGRLRRWVDERLRAELGTTFLPLLLAALCGRVRIDSFTLTSHHFMDAGELSTEAGQARLAACVFRLPYKGEMVPMCRMNAAGIRESFYSEATGKVPAPGRDPAQSNQPAG
ncbi:MAG TPA: radical SAM protein [Thermoanaerobaculia bacterium]|nr:radical SAM protein [Thermoanaerobaculia bacterium]